MAVKEEIADPRGKQSLNFLFRGVASQAVNIEECTIKLHRDSLRSAQLKSSPDSLERL